MLADENDPRAARMNSAGRLGTPRMGGGRLRRPTSRRTAERCRLVDVLVVATDVYAWKLLRLDRGLSVDDVADRMLLMTEALLAATDSRRCRGGAMKILFAIVDGGGNIPPQLAVARALAARGVEVQVLGHRGIRERVEAAGFAFEPFTDGRHFDPTVQRSLAAIMTAFTRVAADRRLGQCVVEAARRHDVDAVVVDMILAAGIPEIVDSGIPTIVFVHCFYRAVQDLAASPVGWMLRLRGTDPLARRTPRAAPGGFRSRRSRPDARTSCGMPHRRRVAGSAEGRRAAHRCRESWSASAHVPSPGSAECCRTSSTRSHRYPSRRP